MANNKQFDEVSLHTLWASDEVDALTAAAASIEDDEPTPQWAHTLDC
jgi:hypothetical protein